MVNGWACHAIQDLEKGMSSQVDVEADHTRDVLIYTLISPKKRAESEL